MDKVNIVVTTSVAPFVMEKIAAVDERINITDASELIAAENKGDSDAGKKLDDILKDAEILLGFAPPKDILRRAPGLKWAQMLSAGVDRLLDSEIWNSPVVMTNVSGVTAVPISEYVLNVMLMFVKQSQECAEMKAARKWQWMNLSVLKSKTVGIIGLGNIGKEVARLCKAFGMEVIATSRTAEAGHTAVNVDKLVALDDLSYLLANSDFVVLTLPLTNQTRNMIGEKELAQMKPSAYLINISRGGVVDEEALIKVLEEKKIAGAGLDVFAEEPLPADSRIWDLDNVIYSPHASAGTEFYMADASDIFVENLKRYLNGDELINVIDKVAGY